MTIHDFASLYPSIIATWNSQGASPVMNNSTPAVASTPFDETTHIKNLERIEKLYADAIRSALAAGLAFYDPVTRKGIGLGDAVRRIEPSFDLATDLHTGIAAAFFGLPIMSIHADQTIGRRIGARLRKLMPAR